MNLFDASSVSTTGVEPGEYIGTVSDAIVKESKTGGEYISLKWQLENGSVFTAMYNIKNANEKAVQIGLADLKKLMLAAGKEPKASGVEELIGLRVLLKVAIKEDDYGEKVVIKAYKKAPEAKPF